MGVWKRHVLSVVAVVVLLFGFTSLYFAPTNVPRLQIAHLKQVPIDQFRNRFLGCAENRPYELGFPIQTNLYDDCGLDESQKTSLVLVDLLIFGILAATTYLICLKLFSRTKN